MKHPTAKKAKPPKSKRPAKVRAWAIFSPKGRMIGVGRTPAEAWHHTPLEYGIDLKPVPVLLTPLPKASKTNGK